MRQLVYVIHIFYLSKNPSTFDNFDCVIIVNFTNSYSVISTTIIKRKRVSSAGLQVLCHITKLFLLSFPPPLTGHCGNEDYFEFHPLAGGWVFW